MASVRPASRMLWSRTGSLDIIFPLMPRVMIPMHVLFFRILFSGTAQREVTFDGNTYFRA